MADSLEYERVHGITVDVNEKRIRYNNKNVVFLDTPGHKDFVPKMISGAAQAEFAILLIDGIRTAFESGISERGQTREHVQLLNALGVSKIIIAINKMDVVGWDKENYEYIVNRTNEWMDTQNFKNIESRQFIPISALSGQNITESPHKKAPASNWYIGPSLVQVFDNLESKCLDDLRKPFRLLISACYLSTGHTKKGFLVGGRIIGGVLKKGDKLIIKPPNINVTVKDIYVDTERKDVALVGELVELIVGIKDDDMDAIKCGNVLSSCQFSAPLGKSFRSKIITYDMKLPILRGSTATFYVGSNKCQGTITDLVNKIDPRSGEVLKSKPRIINSNMAAVVDITLDHPICLEVYDNYPSLGRVQIREKGDTMAVGTVSEILH